MTSATEVSRRRFAPWLGGLVLLAAGATLVGVGLLQTTSSHFGASCPKGTELIAKFKYDHGDYVFDQPSGNQGVVKITNGSSKGGDARSSRPIAATVVQSNSHSVVTSYSPAQKKLHFSSAGLPQDHGKDAQITVVQFCGTVPPTSTTTTTESATTTTQATATTEPATTPTEPETTPTQPATTPVPVTEASTPTSQPNDTTASTTLQSSSTSTTTSVAQEAPAVTSTSILTTGSAESSLPHTGSPSVLLIALGAALMAIGMTFMTVGRARDRRANS